MASSEQRTKEEQALVGLWKCRGKCLRANLSSKGMTYIPAAISTLPNLEALSLKKNCLSALPDEVADLPILQSLDVGHNRLDCFPDCLLKCKSLTALRLNDNPLKSVDDSIGKMTGLTILNLSGCHLEVLPQAIRHLTALTELALCRNSLSRLPQEIGDLQRLRTLCVNTNQLRRLPGSIGNLKNLRTLDVANNQLVTLPRTIGSCIQLTDLDTRVNRIGIYPAQMINLKLEKFDFALNPLITKVPLPVENFDEVVSLKELCARRVIEEMETKPDVCRYLMHTDRTMYDALSAAPQCGVCKRRFVLTCIECVSFVSVKKVFPEVRKTGRVPVQALLCSHNCFTEQRTENQYYGVLSLPSQGLGQSFRE